MPLTRTNLKALKLPTEELMVEYRTRNIPATVLQRARLLAALRHATLESVITEALVYGLKAMESAEGMPPGLAARAAKAAQATARAATEGK